MIRFTLAPVPKTRRDAYFVVTVLAELEECQEYLKERNRTWGRGTLAVHMPRRDVQDTPVGHRSPGYLGELVFWQTPLMMKGVPLLSHELMHATLNWARMRGVLKQLNRVPPEEGSTNYGWWFLSRRSPEERICHAMSAMTAQFVKAGYKAGIWP